MKGKNVIKITASGLKFSTLGQIENPQLSWCLPSSPPLPKRLIFISDAFFFHKGTGNYTMADTMGHMTMAADNTYRGKADRDKA